MRRQTIPFKGLEVMVVGQFPPPVHGSNVMARRLVQALESIEVSPVFVDKGFSKEVAEVGRFSPIKLLRAFAFLSRMGRTLIRVHPRICIYFISAAKGSFLIEAVSIALLRLWGVRYVAYFQGRGFRELAEESRLFGYLIRKVLSKADLGVVLGEALKGDVSWCMPSERLRVIPNAMDSRPRVAREPRRDPRVLFLSNLIPGKGPLEFLRASELVHKKSPATHFVVAGQTTDVGYMNDLRTFVAINDLESQVTFSGAIFGKEKEALLGQCDVFVLPSRYRHEAFPLVVLEAMRASLPVVVFDVGSVSEAVVDNVTGFVVRPNDIDSLADKLLMLIQDPTLRERMGAAGRKRFEDHYTMAQYARMWTATLDELSPVGPVA